MASRLDRIRERLNKATPGPWRGAERFALGSDADFILNAHEDVRLLLDVAEAAHTFLVLDYGYLAPATREGLEPLVAALAALAAEEQT